MKSEFTKNFKLSSLCFYHIICVWERSVVYRGARGRLVSLGLSLASAFWRKVCVCSELYCIMVILYSSINIYAYIYTCIYTSTSDTIYNMGERGFTMWKDTTPPYYKHRFDAFYIFLFLIMCYLLYIFLGHLILKINIRWHKWLKIQHQFLFFFLVWVWIFHVTFFTVIPKYIF